MPGLRLRGRMPPTLSSEPGLREEGGKVCPLLCLDSRLHQPRGSFLRGPVGRASHAPIDIWLFREVETVPRGFSRGEGGCGPSGGGAGARHGP